MEGLTRARVSQLYGLLRLHPAIIKDIEAPDGSGPVPTEGALRKLFMLPKAKQVIRYKKLVQEEERQGRPKASGTAHSHEHLPRRGFDHLLAQARRYQALLDAGEVRSLEEIARLQGVSASRVGQILGLLQLAPDIVDLVDRQEDDERGITYRELLRIARMPAHADQRRAYYSS